MRQRSVEVTSIVKLFVFCNVYYRPELEGECTWLHCWRGKKEERERESLVSERLVPSVHAGAR